MKQCPFLLRLCQEVLLRVFKWFFFFRCPFCRKRKVNAECVSLPHEWSRRTHTAGQTGKNDCCRPAGQVLSDRKHSYFLCCGLPFSRSGDVFSLLVIPFLRIFSWSFFYPICPCFRLPPFCAFQWAASVSHFRSGRKGNSGIGRESKVKPPVFGKNLQPCG